MDKSTKGQVLAWQINAQYIVFTFKVIDFSRLCDTTEINNDVIGFLFQNPLLSLN